MNQQNNTNQIPKTCRTVYQHFGDPALSLPFNGRCLSLCVANCCVLSSENRRQTNPRQRPTNTNKLRPNTEVLLQLIVRSLGGGGDNRLGTISCGHLALALPPSRGNKWLPRDSRGKLTQRHPNLDKIRFGFWAAYACPFLTMIQESWKAMSYVHIFVIQNTLWNWNVHFPPPTKKRKKRNKTNNLNLSCFPRLVEMSRTPWSHLVSGATKLPKFIQEKIQIHCSDISFRKSIIGNRPNK